MTQLAEDRTTHPSLLQPLQAAALERFTESGFPGRSDEEWRFTATDALKKIRFAAAPASIEGMGAESLRTFTFGRDAITELVFVNGHYAPQFSSLGQLPRGVKVSSLGEALESGSSAVQDRLAKLATAAANPFVDLNTGSFANGAYLHIPRGVRVDGAIHLLFISVAGGEPVIIHPRVLVVAEENCEATIVESYVGEGTGSNWTNAVTEIYCAADSRIDHCKLQQETFEAFHLAKMAVHLGRSARFVSQSATIGGKLTRNDLSVVLAGEYADATLNGLVLLDGARHCDNHTLLDHAAANCPSHELYKHVLAGKSTGVFKGKILVRPDSQKTDSKQSSKTLLLSDDAVINSMPALEIYADDVKCTHGSTTGPVDEEQIFYLRSRGVNHEAARHLLTYAFAADITRRIKVEPVRARIENFMAAQHGLPLDLRIADLGAHDEAVLNI